jgi:hypothetical protein
LASLMLLHSRSGSIAFVSFCCGRFWLVRCMCKIFKNVARPLTCYLCTAPMSLSGSQVAISGNMQRITIASIMQTT